MKFIYFLNSNILIVTQGACLSHTFFLLFPSLSPLLMSLPNSKFEIDLLLRHSDILKCKSLKVIQHLRRKSIKFFKIVKPKLSVIHQSSFCPSSWLAYQLSSRKLKYLVGWFVLFICYFLVCVLSTHQCFLLSNIDYY